MKRLNKFIAVAMSVTVLMTSFGGLQNVNATAIPQHLLEKV